jgi:pimeloyl-ACP methyl ester carboxylesterase
MDAYLRRWATFIRWLAGAAPSERDFLEDFFLAIYTPRAHNDGTVDAIIDEALAFPYKQSPEVTQQTLDAFMAHRTIDRLHRISAPTLVLAGGIDATAHPALGRAVADAIPGALFEIQDGESHEPLQEVPDQWNARVDAFWQDVEKRAVSAPRPRQAPDRERMAAPADRTTTS